MHSRVGLALFELGCVMAKIDQQDETYAEAETKARAEAALKRMLATPHKPHKPTGLTPSKAKGRKPKE